MSGYTKIPNTILDSMSELKPAEFKLVMALCRLTYGYQKTGTRASYQALQNLTGLSRQGIINSLPGIEHLFTRENDGGVTIWLVHTVDQYPQSTEFTTSQQSVQEGYTELTGTSQQSVPPSIKEKIKENPKQIKWADFLGLLDFFTEITHIRQPKLNGQGWEPHQEKWIDPVIDLLQASNNDYQLTRSRMRGAVDLMREKKLTIATPKSIYNVALSVNGSKEKVKRVEGGGMYV